MGQNSDSGPTDRGQGATTESSQLSSSLAVNPVMPEYVADRRHPRNLQLDVLRGVAVLLVIGHHLRLPASGGLALAVSTFWFQIGWLGVELFFVLSGFLIGGLLLEELRRHGRLNIKRFVLRRGLKIYPSYFLLLLYLILMPVMKASLRGENPVATFLDKLSLYGPNLFFLQNYVGTNPAGHTWTLAVEEHFYLSLPLLLSALAFVRRVHWALVVMLAAVPVCLGIRCLSILAGDSFSSSMNATHLRFDALFFGVAIRAALYRRPEGLAPSKLYRLSLTLAGVLLWAPAVFLDPHATMIHSIGLTGILFGSAAFLIAAYHTRASDFGPVRHPVRLVARGLAWVGLYSYTIYLWHVSVLGITERGRGDALMAWTGQWAGLGWFVIAASLCGLAILVGFIAARVVEWPILRLRDRLLPSHTPSVPPRA